MPVYRNALIAAVLAITVVAPGPGARVQAADEQYPYPYPPPPPGYPGVVVRGGELRFLIEPRETQVFIDGYYSGIAYDSAGLFQHLHVPPGDRRITLYLDGYKTVSQTLSVTPGATYKLRYSMERLPAGAASEPPPVPPASIPPVQMPLGQPGSQGPPGPPARPMPPRPMPPSQSATPAPASTSNFGTLVIRVQPGGSAIFIDSDHWDGPVGDERLLIQVADGPHHVEVFKDGYKRFTTEIQIRRGETIPLNVSLSPDRN